MNDISKPTKLLMLLSTVYIRIEDATTRDSTREIQGFSKTFYSNSSTYNKILFFKTGTEHHNIEQFVLEHHNIEQPIRIFVFRTFTVRKHAHCKINSNLHLMEVSVPQLFISIDFLLFSPRFCLLILSVSFFIAFFSIEL